MLEIVVDSFIRVVGNLKLQVKPAAQVHYDPRRRLHLPEGRFHQGDLGQDGLPAALQLQGVRPRQRAGRVRLQRLLLLLRGAVDAVHRHHRPHRDPRLPLHLAHGRVRGNFQSLLWHFYDDSLGWSGEDGECYQELSTLPKRLPLAVHGGLPSPDDGQGGEQGELEQEQAQSLVN